MAASGRPDSTDIFTLMEMGKRGIDAQIMTQFQTQEDSKLAQAKQAKEETKGSSTKAAKRVALEG